MFSNGSSGEPGPLSLASYGRFASYGEWMGVSPVTSKVIQIFAFVTGEELKLPVDLVQGQSRGGHRHLGSSPRPFRISLERRLGCGVGLGSTVTGHNKRQFQN